MRDMKLGITITAKAKIANAANKTISALEKIEQKTNTISKRLSKIGAISIGAVSSAGYGVKKFVDSYQEIAKAQGEIASLDISTAGIEKITKAAKDFSNQYAKITAPEFIRASYDIKSGIASLSDSGVADMTRLAALTARATKASVEDMSKLFAMGYGIYRKEFKSDFDFGQKFSAAIAAAVKSFRTDGADLINGLSTLGAIAEKSGYNFEQQLAALGVAKTSYSTASEAATGLKAFLTGVGAAQEKLNLKFTDAKGHLKDIPTILETIKSKYKDLSKKSVQDELKKAFGSDEAIKFIMALIDKTDDLRKSTKELHNSMQEGENYTKKMAQAMNRGYEFDILSHKISNLSSTVGKIFAPAVLKLSNKIGQITDKINDWIEKHPKLAKSLGEWGIKSAVVVASLGALAIGIGAVSFTISTLSKALKIGLSPLNLFSNSIKTGCSNLKCIDKQAIRSIKSIKKLTSSLLSARAIFARGLILSVGIVGVGAVLYGLNQISKATHNAIMDKRTIFGSNKDGSYSKNDLENLLEKEKRLKKRIKAVKEGSILESFLYGQNDKYKLHQLEKLLKRTQKNIQRAKSGWKPQVTKEEKISKKQIQKSVIYAKKVHQIWDLKISENKKRELLKLLASGRDINTIKHNISTQNTNKTFTKNNIQKSIIKTKTQKNIQRDNTLDFLKKATQNYANETKTLKAQYDALNNTVKTIASKPPIQNFNITIHAQSSNPAEIEAAVKKAISNMHYLSSLRMLNDH